VKLLFDQNISPRLVSKLFDLFPGSAHIRDFGLQKADDETVWNLAREQDFIIVSKDSDFRQRSFLYGPPPKVIWVRRGNCSTRDIEAMLRQYYEDIQMFYEDATASFLILS
jgi:predicted nuclease of predicted toxin-antitoxin system